MIKAENRLKRKEDFEKTYKKGRTASEQLLIIKALQNGIAKTRIGFSIGNKFSQKAVIRNKTRRTLRELFYKALPDIKDGFDIVVIPRKGSKAFLQEATRDDWNKALISLIDKAGLKKTNNKK